MYKIIVIAILLSSQTCLSQNIDGEIELGGFFLGQHRNCVHQQLGKPLKRINTDDGWIYEFHAIKPDTSVHALFKYASRDTLHIHSIQMNGQRCDGMHPFKSLVLGDDKSKVNQVLGPYERTDTIPDPTVTVHYYQNKNYSVEIDEAGKLYGIQIFGSILQNKATETIPSPDPFRQAILSKNIDSLLYNLTPDVEVYVSNNVIAFGGAARDEFKRTDSELVKRLLGKSESVWYTFNIEQSAGTAELRFYPDKKTAPTTATVYKFYDSKVLKEIVFGMHAGRWKVYEILFRN